MPYTLSQIEDMLGCADPAELFAQAHRVRERCVGPGVFVRGLVEYSNLCRKDCLYCGIRKSCTPRERYTLTDDEVMDAVRYALGNGYRSIVLQGGEISSESHTSQIGALIGKITGYTGCDFGITLSLGEQTRETYRRWRDAGATRYLLRIETSDRELYRRIHPLDPLHDFDLRLRSLDDLRLAGYQVGTGVMVGLPGQTLHSLACDIVFMRDLDVDMCGMGPYIECEGTPLAVDGGTGSLHDRLELTLRMIAVLRLVCPDINIAATTALETIEPGAKHRAVACGANVVMPNITPMHRRESYALYNGKPASSPDESLEGLDIRFGEKGDPVHFLDKGRYKQE